MKVNKNIEYKDKSKTKLNSKEIFFEKRKPKINPPGIKKYSAANRNPKGKLINLTKIGKKGNEVKANISEKDISLDQKVYQDEHIILKFNLFEKIKEKNWDKCICKLEVNKKSGKIYGTGFFCYIPSKEMKVLITNNHNIDSNVLNEKGLIKYFINAGTEQEKYINLSIERFTYTEEKNDFTIIEIKDEDCIDYFIKVEENGIEENELENENVFSLQYPGAKELSFSSGKIISVDKQNNEYLTYNINTQKGSSGSPIILLKNLKIVGIHKCGVRQLYGQIEKKNKGIFFKIILDKIPDNHNLLNEDNMIKCEYNITKENIGQMVQVYNNQYNIEKDIKRITIYEGNEEKEKIIGGKYQFKKEGRYFIKYYFDESINNLSSMFYDCPLLYKVNAISFSKSNKIDDMSNMFQNCNYLKEVNLTKFNSNNKINMPFMFSQCNSLEKINLPKLNTIKVKNMESLFNDCKNIRELNLSSFDTKNVTNMSNMLNQCRSLSKLDLSSFDTKNVTNMSNMFNQCSSLAKLDLSRFDTKNVTNMSNMFNQCRSLSKLDLSSFDTKNVTDMSNMFNQCSSLAKLDLSRFDTKNVTNMSKMFNNCSSLAKLDFSSFDTKNVTNMTYMFDSCKKLKEIDLSSFNIKNVKDMSYMFRNCYSLNEIKFPSTFKANQANITHIFDRCPSLKNINSRDEKIMKEYVNRHN